jgi:O-Antigen ligase
MIGVRLDVVGDMYLLEPLVSLLAIQCILSTGPGKNFVAPLFVAFVASGCITFCGYLLSDLAVANEPWQYLKGWGRVAMLIVDCAALMVLAARDRHNTWWLALGIGIGGVAALAVDGVSPTQWKLGYGEYVAILVVALAPLCPAFLSIALVLAFGAGCVFADYRSLGAVCLIVASAMLWRRTGIKEGIAKNILRATMVTAVAAMVVGTLLWFTQEEFAERRQESNIGRYVGLVVAWRAITESPLIGYGSWAADEKFGRMFKSEVESMDRNNRRPGILNSSLLPHSQLLQAWIEGGVLGIAFFGLYGWRLIGALRWFAFQRPFDMVSPLFLFFVVNGIWNLLASPFLGMHRINIAIAVAVIAIAAHERKVVRNTASIESTGLSRRIPSAIPQ